MAIRNFWIHSDVDGKAHPLASGPRSKDGRMETTLYVRESGDSVRAVSISCFPTEQGNRIVVRDETNSERIFDRTFTP